MCTNRTVISITKPVSLLFSDKSGIFRLDSVVCLFMKEKFIAILLLNYYLFYLVTYSERVFTFPIVPRIDMDFIVLYFKYII